MVTHAQGQRSKCTGREVALPDADRDCLRREASTVGLTYSTEYKHIARLQTWLLGAEGRLGLPAFTRSSTFRKFDPTITDWSDFSCWGMIANSYTEMYSPACQQSICTSVLGLQILLPGHNLDLTGLRRFSPSGSRACRYKLVSKTCWPCALLEISQREGQQREPCCHVV
jgi:hypothetical protein